MNSLEQNENELDARESSGDSADAVERDDGIPVSGEPGTGETDLDTPDSAGMNDDEPGDGASVAVNDSQCEDRHSRVLRLHLHRVRIHSVLYRNLALQDMGVSLARRAALPPSGSSRGNQYKHDHGLLE